MGWFYKVMKWMVVESKLNDRVIIYFLGYGDVEGFVGGCLGYLLLYNFFFVDYLLGGVCLIEYLDVMIVILFKDKEVEVILIIDVCCLGNLVGSDNDGL